jgi:hypothetical protein
MTDDRVRELDNEINNDEDLFDDLLHPHEIMLELLAEVKRLHNLE